MNNTELNATAHVYKDLMNKIKEIEKQLQPYKSTLEMAALEAGGILHLNDFKVGLIEVDKEIFSLKDAKTVIPESTLKPFIKISSYTQLRVTDK